MTVGYVPYSDDASLFYAQDSGICKQQGLNDTFAAQASLVAVEASTDGQIAICRLRLADLALPVGKVLVHQERPG